MHDGSSLSHEASLKFCCLARVELDALNFEHALFGEHREPLAENVTHLIRVFRVEGCKRLEEGNFVEAQVNRRDLDAALASENLTLPQHPPEDWRKFPFLRLRSIDCLNGLHRVLAARKFLNKNDRWWIARLYTDGRAQPSHVLVSSTLTLAQTYPLLVLAALSKSIGTKRLRPMARSSAKSGSIIKPATMMANGDGGRYCRTRRAMSCESC